MNWKIELNFILTSEARRLVATKTSGQSNSILIGCRFKNKNSFSDSYDESRLFYLLSKIFRSNYHFSKKKHGQKTIFLKKLSVKRTFGQMTIRSMTIFQNKLSVK
jgi:hypothetical protein